MMCTSILIKAKNGAPFWGRTMDFALNFFPENGDEASLPSEIINFPANQEIKSQYENWNTKYAVLGIGLKNFDVLYDGINEEGLVGDVQVLMEATHASKPSLKKRNLTPVIGEEFVLYVLSKCKNLQEVKELAESSGLLDQPFSVAGHDIELFTHYTFFDSEGNGLVLEPTNNGSFKIYESNGVMTNSPEYSYHTTNVRNYISLHNYSTSGTSTSGKLKLEPIEKGTGYGLFGLPGDYTSPSRFIRALFISNNIDEFEEKDGIKRLYDCFKPVMIPRGLERISDTSDESDSTQYWAGYDIKNRTLYVQYPETPTMTKITLDTNTKDVQKYNISQAWKTNSPKLRFPKSKLLSEPFKILDKFGKNK